MHLQILDVTVEVATPDERWDRFLRWLWAPLVVEPRHADLLLTVADRGNGWALQTDAGDAGLSTDPWLIADGLRHQIVETAVPLTDRVLDLHAAALVRDQDVLLLAGESGAGKTTLCLALRHRGWSVMSDDLAPIDRATGWVTAFPKPMGIKDPLQWAPSPEAGMPGWPGRPGGEFLSPAPDPMGRSARPTHLVFPAFEPAGEDRVRSVTSADAIVRMGRLMRRIDPVRLKELARFVDAIPVAEMTYRSTSGALGLLDDWFRSAHRVD